MRKRSTQYVLVKWNEYWAKRHGGLTIEPKYNLEHLKLNWNIEVLCDDQPKKVLEKMMNLTKEK